MNVTSIAFHNHENHYSLSSFICYWSVEIKNQIMKMELDLVQINLILIVEFTLAATARLLLKRAQNDREVGVSFWWTSSRELIRHALFFQLQASGNQCPMITQIWLNCSIGFILHLIYRKRRPFRSMHNKKYCMQCRLTAGLVKVDAHMNGTDSGATYLNTPAPPLSVSLPAAAPLLCKPAIPVTGPVVTIIIISCSSLRWIANQLPSLCYTCVVKRVIFLSVCSNKLLLIEP